jgi:type IV pilus assembly protein PilO
MASVKGLSFNSLPIAGRIGFGAFILAASAGAFYFLFYADVVDQVAKERTRTATLQAEENVQKQAQLSYFADRDELAIREQREREFNKILPAETEAAGFLSTIQQVSNVAGISLNAWQPQEEQTQSFFAKVPMKLEVTGRFHQLAKFMFEVGRTDRIINVENIELSEPKVVGDEVVLKAKCLTTTFHLLKPVATPAAGTAPAVPGSPQPGAPPASAPQPGVQQPGTAPKGAKP